MLIISIVIIPTFNKMLLNFFDKIFLKLTSFFNLFTLLIKVMLGQNIVCLLLTYNFF